VTKTKKRNKQTAVNASKPAEVEINLVWLILGVLVVLFIVGFFRKIKSTADSFSYQNIGEYTMFVKVNVDDSPVRGDISRSKVVMFEFSDPVCPVCQRFVVDPAYTSIIDEFVKDNTLAVVSKYFVAVDSHKNLGEPGIAFLECVHSYSSQQYWDAKKDVYSLYMNMGSDVTKDDLFVILEQLGAKYNIDAEKVKACLNNPKYLEPYKETQNYVLTTLANLPLPKEYKEKQNINAFAQTFGQMPLGTPMFVLCRTKDLDNKKSCTGYPVVGLMGPSALKQIISDLANYN